MVPAVWRFERVCWRAMSLGNCRAVSGASANGRHAIYTRVDRLGCFCLLCRPRNVGACNYSSDCAESDPRADDREHLNLVFGWAIHSLRRKPPKGSIMLLGYNT